MKIVILYDRRYKNTEKIATVIASAFDDPARVYAKSVDDVDQVNIDEADVLLIGSPSLGGRPSDALYVFLKGLPRHALDHKLAASFDTRPAINEQRVGLRLFSQLIGFSSERINAMLETKGAQICAEPTGFILSSDGTLKIGELIQATRWAERVFAKAKTKKTEISV